MRSRQRSLFIAFALFGAAALVSACTTQGSGGGGGPTNQPPTAEFTFSPNNQYAPVTVNFDASTSTDDSGIVDYNWNFGDGTPEVNGPALSTTSYGYTNAQAFTVTLTVKDAQGLTGSVSHTVTVLAHVDADGDGYYADVDDCDDSDASIHPGATDTFGDGIDQNCDTVDGVATDVIFVSKNGSDTPQPPATDCGLTPTTACREISTGLAAAASQSRPNVYVTGGSYNAFTMTAGVQLYGNFGSSNWKRGGGASGDAVTIVNASAKAVADWGTVAIVASNISTATRIDGLTVQGTAAAAGKTSYGIISTDSTNALTIANVAVIGGTGGAGSVGTNGSNASQTAPPQAQAGENAKGGTGGCDKTSRQAGGTGSANANSTGTGGGGGASGLIDNTGSICPFGGDATGGLSGGNGWNFDAGNGNGGSGGAANTNCCSGNGGNGSPGQNGKVTDAAAAAGGSAAAGAISVSDVWVPAAASNGANGTLGTDGGGGGGGGGGGSSDNGTDDWGAGGGAGGTGGVRAPGPGTAGTTGGASIGILLVDSSPVLTNVTVTLGTGGAGGAGGNGGIGQPGGLGGAGGAAGTGGCIGCTGSGGAGGNGGNGARGGNSGAGGGAAGAPALGIATHNSTTDTSGVTFSGGAGGAGGAGGTTGVAAGSGATGSVANVAAL